MRQPIVPIIVLFLSVLSPHTAVSNNPLPSAVVTSICQSALGGWYASLAAIERRFPLSPVPIASLPEGYVSFGSLLRQGKMSPGTFTLTRRRPWLRPHWSFLEGFVRGSLTESDWEGEYSDHAIFELIWRGTRNISFRDANGRSNRRNVTLSFLPILDYGYSQPDPAMTLFSIEYLNVVELIVYWNAVRLATKAFFATSEAEGFSPEISLSKIGGEMNRLELFLPPKDPKSLLFLKHLVEVLDQGAIAQGEQIDAILFDTKGTPLPGPTITDTNANCGSRYARRVFPQ